MTVDLRKKLCWTILNLFLFFLPAASIGQNTGLVFNDEAYEQLGVDSRYLGARASSLPPKLSLKPFCPYPGDQQNTGSCAGWACGYGALTIERAVQEGRVDRQEITETANSAYYIYNQIKKSDCYEGADLVAAMGLLQQEGDCLQQSFGDHLACEKKPQRADSLQALKYRIKSYQPIFGINEPIGRKIRAIQGALVDLHPVVIGMDMPAGLKKVDRGETYWQPDADEALVGGHALVVVGYDHGKDWRETTFEVMNSWGRQWADDGFIRIPAVDLAEYIRYGFTIELSESAIDEVRQHIDARFSFVRVTVDQNGNILREPMSLTLDPQTGQYWLDGKKVMVTKDLFQLRIDEGLRGRFGYLIGLDEHGSTQLFWPENTESPGAAILAENSAVLPYPDTALELASKKDQLTLLISNAPINNLDLLLQRVDRGSGNLPERLKGVFRDRWSEPSTVTYRYNDLGFTVEALPPGKIVPLVIRIHE